MKFDLAIEDNNRIYLKKSFRREIRQAGRLVPDLFLFFKKASYEVNASVLQLSFNILRYSSH